MRAGSPTVWASRITSSTPRQRFADAVIGDFADSYAAGETPVPCVRCNQTVKFADLTALARGLGCERLATGHYVRRIDGPDGAELHRAADLGARPELVPVRHHARSSLRMRCFRWATMPDKRAVRAEAERLGLPVAGQAGQPGHLLRPLRQLRRHGGAAAPGCAGEAGEIVSRDGRVVARHDGIARYTVGQGKRLGAAAMDGGERQMVVALEPRDAARGGGAASTRRRAMVRLREVNWLVAAACGAAALHGEAARPRGAAAATVRGWRWRGGAAGRRRRCRRRARLACSMTAIAGAGRRVHLPAGAVDACGGGGLSPAPLRIGWRRSSAVEQGNHNPLVGGSNPPAATIYINGLRGASAASEG